MRTTLRILTVLFVLWHAAAVAIFAIPREAQDSFARLNRIALLPIVSPYIWSTGQWQQWNLFSPDPDVRGKVYVFQIYRDGAWVELERLERGSYSILHHSTKFKLLHNAFEPFAPPDLAAQYLRTLCTKHALAPSTPIRSQLLVYTQHKEPTLEEGPAIACNP